MSAPQAIPTEPIGSIPRPAQLIQAIADSAEGRISGEELDALYEQALVDTIRRFEQTGSPVISDGEQTKPSFATYPIHGAPNLAPEGFSIPFLDGHVRQLPLLSQGPFRYQTHAETYFSQALKFAASPLKQAVISASALSLLYPSGGLTDYTRQQFIEDLVSEAQIDIRGCLDAGAYNVQIDFTEARLSLKLDPSKKLLSQFLELNNRVLAGFSDEQRKRIGVHTCPGGGLGLHPQR